jgi:hypothetical protein
MDSLIEMNKAAGRDKNQISLLVAQVNSAYNQANKKFDKFINGLVVKCKSGTRLQKSYIAKIEADILSAKARGNKAESDNKTLENDKIKYGRDLAAAQKQLKGLKQSINKAYEEYKIYGIEAEQKLVAIKTLKDIITDELLAKHGQSFIQVEAFNDKVRELQAMLKDADDSMSPLVATLLQLAETRGFSNKNILNSILTVLNKLEASVSSFRRRQENEGKKNIENLKTQAKEKVKQVRAIARLLADTNSQILDNKTIMTTSARDVKTFESHKIRKTAERRYWAKICKYQNGIKKREHEFRLSFTKKVKEVSAKLAEMK